jgi:predicted nucleotidyltransferase
MPDMQPADDPILKRFHAALDEIYGERIERVVLFGSRARGDAREDSDYDVAVFLKDLTDRSPELDRLADLSTYTFSMKPANSRRFLQRAHTADARNPHWRHRFMKSETAAFCESQGNF